MKWFRTAALIAVPLLIALLVAISSGRISNDAAVALHEPDAGREVLTQTRLAQDQVAAVRFNSETGSPAFISGSITPPAGANPLESSQSFFEANKDLYRMSDPATELILKRQTDDELGMSHVHLSQQYQGLPVYAAEVSVHFSRDGKIVSVNGNYVPDIAVNPTPDITIDDAVKVAQGDLGYDAPSSSRELPLLTVFAPAGGAPQLTWQITLASDDRALRMAYFVDAHTGGIAARYDMLETARNRLTYTAENGTDLPGTLLISEGGSSTDPVVQAAHDNAGLTYDYYQNTFGLDSFDGAGATLISTAHFDFAYNNAFWNGHQMVYGDGDGYNFGPFSQASDVVAHELTHAVTEYSAGLVYVLQSGALNESYSDVFGAMVDRDDWLMGEDIYTPGTPGDALRSLSNPAAYGDPEHMSDFVQTYYDNGGVHTNSGIPNKAAYNVATAIGKAKMEQIWYRTLTLYLNAGSQFLDARDASVQAAADLYGAGSSEATATANGFAAVGLDDTQPTEISGVVTNEAGGPIQDIYVIAYHSNGQGGWNPATNSSTDASGVYTLRGLAGGDYRVEFTDMSGAYFGEFYNDKSSFESADTIAVAPGAAVTGKNAVLIRSGSISGTVTDEAGTAVAGVQVWSCKQNEGGSCTWYSYTQTNADGGYTLGGLEGGGYKVEFGYESNYIVQYYDNKPDIGTADPISVGPGAQVTGKDAVLVARGSGSISGTVTNGAGPLEGITVFAFPPDDQGSVASATTGADGTYTLGSLPIGDYKLQFYPLCIPWIPASCDNISYISEFYNDKPDFQSADIITVSTGAPVTGKDAVLILLDTTRTYDFTWYDNVGADNWILMSNPAGSGKDLNFDLTVDGEKRDLAPFALQSASCPGGQCGAGQVPAGMTLYPRFYGVRGGPVSVTSLGGDKAIVSQRSVWAGGSLEEVPGTDAERRSSHFYWTWYDQLAAGTVNWVLVANPNEAPVYFEVTIAGQPAGPDWSGVIEPGKNVTPTFAGQRGGPVEVRAWTNSGKSTPAEVIASQRVLSGNGSAFNEVPGIPAEELSDSYIWTWYDNIGGQNWVLVANPNPMTIYYQIELNGGCSLPGDLPADKACETGSIAVGQNVTSMLAGKRGGPLEVRTWADIQHNTPATSIASQRMLWGPSFEEVPGYPTAALASDYHWTWYDQQTAGVTNWVLVANPNDTPVYYEITIGGELAGPGSSGTIQPGQNVIPTFDTRMGGPVEVRAWTGSGKGTPAEVMASQRVLWKGYFNEVLGTVLE